ncbi:D-glycero-beta-D-manno-heptose 1-phosphate adenylyltransferase [Oculatella sp. LEGE 06141]|uniref:D-glycero-beta-D-manno-heptose 1-phosphate adenylyltransferase n=1 Tax=Oculatella sp. LEGE 06141 TaxID=1828648 RepID=UPI001880C2FE|nr:D-glycero-beta-D-manno-heptose 1-phosphate adenylyltransferase [Oculatella sp. LEGE 06141]MBE9180442.1 D-glycero-beta-D-manno-heptose 1-phosphate adenylyltransferase [Oculatella sp. LEGE 06141]
MTPTWSTLVDTWKSLTVLVIGEAMLDCYLNGTADRLCQEAPVPVVALRDRQDYPGGAANTAANLHSLGGCVHLLSVIGADAEGDRLHSLLQQRGLSTASLIAAPQRTTLAKQRVLANAQLLLRFDQGSTEAIAPELEAQIIERLTQLMPDCDAVVISDYNYGILTPRVIQAISDLYAQYPQTLTIDSRQLNRFREVRATAVKPNYDEATRLLGLPKQEADRATQLSPYGDRLHSLTGAAIVAVTLDREGAIVFEQGQPPYRTETQPVPDAQTAGAGDTFISALTLALAGGASTPTAAAIAAHATRLVIAQPGTTTCDVNTLAPAAIADRKLGTYADVMTCVQHHRRQGHRIVLTNGCFDILHPGHITYLAQAKALGDILMVGVNTDERVRALKGADRPINSLSDRLTLLAALDCVDYVIPFAEATPCELIRVVRPHLFVKGGDYTRDTLPEASVVEALGGEVRILPYVGDRSTTKLIQQIRAVPASEIGIQH